MQMGRERLKTREAAKDSRSQRWQERETESREEFALRRGTISSRSRAKESRMGEATSKCVGVGGGASRRRALEDASGSPVFQVGSKVMC